MNASEPLHVLARQEDPDLRVLTLTLTDGATFEVAPDAPEADGLEVGVEVDELAFAGLERAAQRKGIAKRVFRMLDRRMHTRAELRRKLVDSGYDASICDTVLEGFAGQGLVDDASVAAAFVRDQLARKPVGRGYLRQKLRAKGVDDALIDQALDAELPRDREPDLAAVALRRKAGGRGLPRERAMRFLLSRGFPRGVAARVALAAGGPGDDAS